jgi:predicted Zn-dependent peptidase
MVADSVGTIQQRSILRGPQVHILEDHRLPTVSFGIFFPVRGRLLETDRNAGITELMLRTALRGAGSFSVADIARRIEDSGARIDVVNEPDFFGYMLNGFPGRMDQALRVLIEVLQSPTFDEVQVAQERTIQSARIQSIKDDIVGLPRGLFMQTLFIEHPYARLLSEPRQASACLPACNCASGFGTTCERYCRRLLLLGIQRHGIGGTYCRGSDQ